MLNFQLNLASLTTVFLSQFAIASLLTVVIIFFGALLFLGVRKSYKLKKENERLEAMSPQINEEKDKPYNDFTQGHMYDKK